MKMEKAIPPKIFIFPVACILLESFNVTHDGIHVSRLNLVRDPVRLCCRTLLTFKIPNVKEFILKKYFLSIYTKTFVCTHPLRDMRILGLLGFAVKLTFKGFVAIRKWLPLGSNSCKTSKLKSRILFNAFAYVWLGKLLPESSMFNAAREAYNLHYSK